MADDQGIDGKVHDIAEGKAKQKRKRDGTGQPLEQPAIDVAPNSKGLLYRAVGLAIDRSEYSLLPAFPRRFVIVEPAKGIRNVLEVDEETGVCEYIDLAGVRNAILRYVTVTLCGRPGYSWEARQAKDCADHWLALAEPVPEPPAVLWQGEEGLCFNRLPWAFAPDYEGDQTPTFNALFSRISNASALIEWVGSLFDPAADRQQYVWLYGQGGDGKGALVRFLKRVLGRAFASKQPPARDEVHWTSGLLGKRLIVFPDANAAGFPASGLFKSLTGGDPVDINPKYKSSYCVELLAKYLFLSNARPLLSSEKADMRRAIYCEFSGGPSQIDPTFERKLWAEGGAFLSTCINNYQVGYPEHVAIRTDTAELDDWVAVVEEGFEVAFERRLEAVALPAAAGEAPRHYALASQMQELMKQEGFDRRRQIEFLAWLERTHGVKRHRIRINGEVHRVYIGVRVRSQFEQNEAPKW